MINRLVVFILGLQFSLVEAFERTGMKFLMKLSYFVDMEENMPLFR